MHNPLDYDGICACCFNPILKGEGQKIMQDGKWFHKTCIGKNGYYERLEKRKLAKMQANQPASEPKEERP